MHPLNIAIEQGEAIRNTLGETAGNLAIAQENELVARQARRSIEEMYDAAEAELTSIAMLDGRIDGKNAETRKAQLDALLVQERTDGILRTIWQNRTEAINAHEAAKMILEQCSTHFSATRHAADLTTAILRAMTV